MDFVLNYVIPMAITLVGIAAFVIICTICTKNKSENAKMWPIRIMFFVLVAMEIAKIYYLIRDNGEFRPLRYPIVFCSMIMYTYPIFCFKKNRFSDVAMSISCVPFILGFIAVMATTTGYEMNIIHAHSFFYHGAMCAVSIYLITSKLYKFEYKKYFPLFIGLSAYIVMCTVLSIFIGGDISFFGPNSGQLGFLYNIFGYAVGNLLLIFVLFLLTFITYGIIGLIQRKKASKHESEDVANV